MVRCLKRRDCERHGLGSKPTRSILLCPWKKHFTALCSVWQSWHAVLDFSYVSIKLKTEMKNFYCTAISGHFRKQSGRVVKAPGLWSTRSRLKTYARILLYLGKDTLQHFPLLGGLSKQF